jgi:hypothetical protein
LGFRGIDPSGLIQLANTADQYAQRIGLARSNTGAVLRRHGYFTAVGLDVRVAVCQLALTTQSEELRWRAGVITETQRIEVTNGFTAELGLDRFAATAVFDLDTWRADYEHWRVEQIVAVLAPASPEDRAAAFEVMSNHDRHALVALDPGFVGSLDGAPPTLRYEANRALIRAEIEEIEEYMAQLEDVLGVTDMALRPLAERVAEYQRWLDEGRQILLFDPVGDGLVVEVFGNLSKATHAAVVVPGMANDIHNFSDGDTGFRDNARSVYEMTSGTGVATVAWLGYDSPDNVGATLRAAADDGAPSLQRFLRGIDPGNTRTITVIAHSYGSVLAGVAAATGLEADNLVVVGSPGTTLDTVGDAQLRDGGRVWVGLADGDPIALGVNTSELPPWWVPPVLWAPWLGADLWNDGAEDLWHGTNPASVDFGAIRFSTEGSSGHSEYFEAGSLDNLAKIVAGLYDDVEIVD